MDVHGAPAAPDGFEPMPSTCGLHAVLGPLHVRWGDDFALGFRVDDRHTNPKRTLHGGTIAAVADMAMGYALRPTPTTPLSAVTTAVTVTYLGPAAIGDWVEARVEVIKRGKLPAVRCDFWCGQVRIASASASFFVVAQGAPAA